MIKRSIFYITLCLVLSFSLFQVYKYYQPKEEDTITNTDIEYQFDKVLSLSDFNELVTSSEDSINVIFYQNNSLNCQYLFNTLVPSLLSARGDTALVNCNFVNLDDIDFASNTTFTAKYGFSSVPFLANLCYEDGQIVINDSLLPNETALSEGSSVENWLEQHNIISLVETTTEENED